MKWNRRGLRWNPFPLPGVSRGDEDTDREEKWKGEGEGNSRRRICVNGVFSIINMADMSVVFML